MMTLDAQTTSPCFTYPLKHPQSFVQYSRFGFIYIPFISSNPHSFKMHINFIFLRYSLFISVITFAHGRTMVVVDGTGRAFTTNTTFSGSIVTIRQPSQFIEATLSAITTGTAALTINITDRFIQQPSSPPILTINITDRLIQPSSSPTITTSSTATSTSAEPGESQTGTGTAQTDIIVALRSNPDTTQFADRLDGDPDFNKLVQRVNEKTKSNITIFAPANDAMEKYYQGILQRTDDKYESEVARQFTYRALGEEDIYSAPLVWNVLDSDSQHVNLGENEPQRLVSEPEDNKNVAIISGLGRKVSVCSDGIGFSLGCIKATSE